MAGDRANSQANVIENQATSIYVDATKGTDVSVDAQTATSTQVGTVSAPLKTIQAAVNLALANNKRSVGTKIVINPGIYRETVTIGGSSNQTSAPITLQAAATGASVLSGSDVYANWNQVSWNPAIYQHSFSSNGTCAIPSGWPTNFAPIARRTELVFVNGAPLTQVMSYSQLVAGTFYVDDSGGQIFVAPGGSVNMSASTVEIATRPTILNISRQNNVVLRGLVLEHAASCINRSGATINSSSNVLVDQVQASWNNWGGLGINSSSNVTVQNSVASYNGGVGFQANQDTNAYYNYNETDYNNWRGAQAALYDWGMGGTKLMGMRSTTVQNQYSYRNQAQGLWFDTDNTNITVNSATLAENVLAALQVERNPGPVTLTQSNLCSNGIGVNVLTSENLTISNNFFYNNGGTNVRQGEIYLAGTVGGQTISNWQNGQTLDLFTTGMGLWNNTFQDASAGQYLFGTYLTGNDWSRFADSLNAGGNAWFDPSTTSAFLINGNHKLSLSAWQGSVGTDYSSYWGTGNQSPSSVCTVPSPQYADFSVNLDNRSYTMSGGVASATVRVNSFGFGPVSLSVTGMPSGVGAWLSQQYLSSGVVTLNVYAQNWAANQTVPITLWASGNGRVHSVTFYVHVIPS